MQPTSGLYLSVIDAYEEAGGTVMRDLFQGDDGGWLQDAGLLDRLVVEKLQRDAETVAAEGWKWIEVVPDFAYGHHFGLRQLRGDTVLLTVDEESDTRARCGRSTTSLRRSMPPSRTYPGRSTSA